MKNSNLFILLLVLSGLFLSSCYTYSVDYGKGPQKHIQTEEIDNHYFLYGLVPGVVEAPVEPDSGAADYRVTVETTFIDGLISYITMGIYTPTTTFIIE